MSFAVRSTGTRCPALWAANYTRPLHLPLPSPRLTSLPYSSLAKNTARIKMRSVIQEKDRILNRAAQSNNVFISEDITVWTTRFRAYRSLLQVHKNGDSIPALSLL
ncbi:hypothetical protein GDO81_010594 [Engystomops pustulosus]|uniref:Uncharacterized protein n=1 Tax=Engystomops pustulosus TaxID=76066 RepID=A0AAV7C193_ENGPU|nr:hypothetical protein GDO81_010594 [Engystomops pustulosus]